jgi:hypothetical protein
MSSKEQNKKHQIGVVKMGQRHQFFVKLPFGVHQEREVWDNNTETNEWYLARKEFKELDIVALHHQWHYGTLPLKSLKRLIEFYNKSINSDYKYSLFKKTYGDADDIKLILSVNAEEAEISHFSLLDFNVALNPLLAENNDGITIVDLSHGQARYGFMFLNDIEKVLSAEEYVRHYYNGKEYTRFIADQWQGWDADYAIEWEKMVLEHIAYYNDKEMLTIEEVKKMFPAMYEEVK